MIALPLEAGLPGAAEPPLLEVRAASKAFGGRAAICDVSFRLERGQFLAVVGTSGAGKTTLLRSLAGLMPLDAGKALLGGVDVAELHGRERRRIAVVFQQFNLVGRLTALQNVLAGRLGYVPAWRGWLRRFTRPDVQLALESLERVGLIAHAAQRADTLPDVILADEPVASLDPRSGEGILELLRGICHTEKDGVAVICSLHQPSFARRFADRVVGLAGGRIVVDIAAGELVESTLRAVYGAGSAELDS
ncbi:MAG TPA: ATP-binding cassette domain-containing protein [Kofleriaceae bacterium]|nr:ATP-binding cassette domain-containing protein [Kofleriaceae bacterium]